HLADPPHLHSFPTRRSSDLRRFPRLEPAEQRRVARCPRQGLCREEIRPEAACPHDHELADVSTECSAERHEQGRRQVLLARRHQDRKSTRLNSSHEWISYAV